VRSTARCVQRAALSSIALSRRARHWTETTAPQCDGRLWQEALLDIAGRNADGHPRMMRDLAQGRRPEIDALCGAPRELGEMKRSILTEIYLCHPCSCQEI
jgi:ketopantoate reductase